MVETEKFSRANELLSELYEGITYSEFQVALEFANRAFFALCSKDKSFNTKKCYLCEYGCEDELLRSIVRYYLEGKASLGDVQEYIFPMINVLSKCKPSKKAEELKGIFLSVYEK
ncbi:hypothetical protein GOM49_07370 [Clostridium bovifaecis]|uniref:Uncharacterized protein n=1 Tax=Clostridium bovifaecis TaxID=2184719 RepID=A0A6I6ERW4_9CLOT|nr:hypothetical protein GOM49_07370 [Clostridium bovifaecis]